MISIKESLEIPLDYIHSRMIMRIFSNSSEKNNLLEESDHERYNEAKYQVFEGRNYWYKLSPLGDWKIDVKKTNGVFGAIAEGWEGSFSPNTFVGTLQIPFKNELTNEVKYVPIEVRSSKISYEKGITDQQLNRERSEYQAMLDQIAEQSVDLVMQFDVPVQQSYESTIELIDEKQLYQRFIFVKSLFQNQEFEEAVQKIMSNPSTRWITREEERDVRSIRRFTAKNVRELITRSNRMPTKGIVGELDSIPIRVHSTKKEESVDTPENRFVKHVLTTFLAFTENIHALLKDEKAAAEHKEVEDIQFKLENLLNRGFFKGIGRANSLKINSPVLQRKSGYRELLKAWLRFHLTAQLSWNLGENEIFSGGKKDIATLYEYWVFFALFRAFEGRFGTNSNAKSHEWIQQLIVPNASGLELKLQEGKKLAFEFLINSGKRDLQAKFYYNRTFRGGLKYADDKGDGSYTKSFRPDYTISIWPSELNETEAEEQEAIVHIHFDAKYKVEYVDEWKEREEANTEGEKIKQNQLAELEISEEEKAERRGTYKNVDLYKMHAYKDAIRRTGGAYILYPGNTNDMHRFQGYHEVIPGVGAFSLRPSNQASSAENIGNFIEQVISNLEDVLSHREQLAKSKRLILKDQPIAGHNVDEELYQIAKDMGVNESLNDTYVLVGYCKQDSHHYDWITQTALKYNIRFGDGYPIDGKIVSSKYLVLYEEASGELKFKHDAIFSLNPNDTRLYSKQELIDLGYPSAPTMDQYLVFSVEKQLSLGNHHFDMRKIQSLQDLYSNGAAKRRPYTITLAELLSSRRRGRG